MFHLSKQGINSASPQGRTAFPKELLADTIIVFSGWLDVANKYTVYRVVNTPDI